MTVSQETHRAY